MHFKFARLSNRKQNTLSNENLIGRLFLGLGLSAIRNVSSASPIWLSDTSGDTLFAITFSFWQIDQSLQAANF